MNFLTKKYLLTITLMVFCLFNLAAQDKITLAVSGACGMCKDRIEATALKNKGVKSADYDIDNQTLTLSVNASFSKNELINALLAVGHDTEGQKASDEVYNALHSCCHYRDSSEEDSHDDSEHEGHQHTEGDGHVHTEGDGHVHTEGDEHTHDVDQHTILSGTVYEKSDKGDLMPLIGANITWLNSKEATSTDLSGQFNVPYSGKKDFLIVSYVGYSPDTLMITKAGNVSIVISTPNLLDAVEITHRRRSTEISYLETVKVHQITSKELLKAACCNLAESFDTTPAVDASSTDAVTGTRKIEMLGLAGPYVQITRENMPDVRGLAALQGLSFTPGPWIEGMQLNMGAGSVVNGFESITGQINVEMRKPCHEDKMYFNAYGSQAARLELNTFAKNEINNNWSTATLLHASTRSQRRDHNHDGFLDMPLGKQFGFVNRWKWTNNEGQEGQIGLKLTFADNISGQVDFDPLRSLRYQTWGADMTTQRADFWVKRGFVNLKTPYKTLGFQFSGTYHDQKSQFGLRRYDAVQKSLYFNMIYQSIIDNTDHQVRMGTSFQYDHFNELVLNDKYLREEIVPGVFGEYTYKGSEKFSLLVGGRADYHNNYGLFFTPRLNVRYAPTERTVFRLAAGRGQKTASIFAENIGIFASSRAIIIEGGDKTKTPYGLNAEVAWNIGISATQDIYFGKKILSLSADFNRVDFANQIIVDLDRTARQVVFYNLNGQSYSNSLQLQAEMSPSAWLDLRLAYRYNDVKTTYGEALLRKPLISPQRAFANFAIHPGKNWTIDYTINWLSSVRIPSTEANDEAHRWASDTPSYFLSNAQISKNWNDKFEFYVGGENIGNYRLQHPIIAAHNPFGQYFDSSLAWGPIMGINLYAGVRYSIK
ncbi:MAG: TonB-dependent receptor [Saprospiraceae bacterium]